MHQEKAGRRGTISVQMTADELLSISVNTPDARHELRMAFEALDFQRAPQWVGEVRQDFDLLAIQPGLGHADTVLAPLLALAESYAALLRAKAGGGDSARTSVFIVGMPRSGTTLIEQIIASHPKAVGAGELVLGASRCTGREFVIHGGVLPVEADTDHALGWLDADHGSTERALCRWAAANRP